MLTDINLRTLTVFWPYHVRLAIRAMEEHEEKYDYKADGFGRLKNYLPALFIPELHKVYYSEELLRGEYAERFWMLPDLRELVVSDISGHVSPEVREQLFKVANNNESGHDPERVLRFSFYVVRRYLRPREPRSRNIILIYAFASLEKYLIRLRTKHKAASPYSLTQTYFFIQLVHAALAQLASHRHANFVQDLSFPLFKQISGISSTSWQDYYSKKLWNSFEARASLVFPDLKPLPDTVTPFADLSRNDFQSRLTDEFLDVGLIPELPPLEFLHFYQDLFMATVPSLPERMSPAGVTSYETFIKYTHESIFSPSDSDTLLPLAHHNLNLLIISSPLSARKFTFYLRSCFHSTTNTLSTLPLFSTRPFTSIIPLCIRPKDQRLG